MNIALPAIQRFQPFSTSHKVVLLLFVAFNLLIYLKREELGAKLPRRPLHVFLAVWLLFLEFSMQIYYYSKGIWSMRYALPLHLCDIALFLCVIMLLSERPIFYELTYFLGLGGATQALITPNILYPFPHLTFIQFFLTHGSVVTICLYITFAEKRRPTLRSVRKAFIFTNLYALLMVPFNYLTGSNYLFLMRKPSTPSLLDYLGPWPYYILSLELVVLAVYLLWYLPVALSSHNKKNDEHAQDHP